MPAAYHLGVRLWLLIIDASYLDLDAVPGPEQLRRRPNINVELIDLIGAQRLTALMGVIGEPWFR